MSDTTVTTLSLTPGILGLAVFLTVISAVGVTFAVIGAYPCVASNPIPGPQGYFIVGEVPEIRRYSKESKTFEYFEKVVREYGSIAEVKLVTGLPFQLFYSRLFVTNDKELVHLALTDSEKFKRGRKFHDSTIGIAENLLFALPSGDTWKRHRKFLQPAFAPAQLRFAGKIITDRIGMLLDFWETRMNGEQQKNLVVDFHDALTCVAMDIIGLIAFSHDFNSLNAYFRGNEGTGHEMLIEAMKVIAQRNASPKFAWPFLGLSSAGERVTKIRRYLDKLFDQIIAEKKNQPANTNDLLGRLLDVDGDERQKFTDKEIFGEAIAFIFAGHETTANTLTFTALELSRNPQIQKRLKEEIKSVIERIGSVSVENLSEF
ncbi:hypothetical protein HK100_004641, partial [Physocladia obscura]